ncbi:discoidin domain-containing protein [Streptomyces sp. NPDC049687]|uniref:discoidin domain-containing protein n=1 Tax=Streptomyces sp. NPDC049687 TaxID=3365596 RepID=UPI0037B7DC54
MTLIVQMQDTGTTAANDPLLSYTITTTPSPLKAWPENPEATGDPGEIVIAVARQSGTIADVESIRLRVPAGTMSPDLTTDLAAITAQITLDGWSVRLDTAAKEFVFSPAAGHTPIGPDLGFTIQLSDIPMSRKVGTSPLTLTEKSRTGNAQFQERTTVFNVGKFPADFYLRNFLCEPSIISNGGDVKLTWERSANATYELLYPGVERDVTNRTSLELEGIASDTAFYLRATTGDPTNPVTRILSTQVTVLKPDLDVGNLTVNGNVIAKGDLTIAPDGQLTVPKIVSNGDHIEVGSSIQQTAGGITVSSGGLTVQGDSTVSGALTATTVTARNNLVVGLASASALYNDMPGHTADKMVDGRDDTFYQSRFFPRVDDWAMVDLGEIRRITSIEIHCTLIAARVETSTDQSNWTSHGQVTPPVSSHALPGGGVEARYVRVLITQPMLVAFQINQFIVTPGAAFAAGFGPSGALGVEQTAGDAPAVTTTADHPAAQDGRPTSADAPVPPADADSPDGTPM